MAKQKYIRTEYNDGNVVLSNIRKGRASIPVIGLNDSYTATKVNTWFDGSPMTPEKADGSVYLQLSETGEYFKVNLPNDGELFLEKDTVAQLRDMSAVEILLLRMGYYKGVTLNGYYNANDTPAPIQYYLSDTTESDDGGSVFEVGGVKLEHEFVGEINSKYFGLREPSIPTDQTSIIQRIVDLSSVLKIRAYFPKGTYYINGRYNPNGVGVLLKSNTSIRTDIDTYFKVLPSESPNYSAFSIRRSNNVVIDRLNVIGEKDEHLGDTGEWGMGLDIRQSDNIHVTDLKAENFWGDGIYLGKGDLGGTNNNIVIDGADIRNCRRQGISIVTGNNVFIKNVRIGNIEGASPQFGIDVEPNDVEDVLININFSNIQTYDCAGGGILINLMQIHDSGNDVSINIDNHYSLRDVRGFQVSGVAREGYVLGNINYNKAYIHLSKFAGINLRNYTENAPLLVIQDPIIIDPVTDVNTETDPKYATAIQIYRENTDIANYKIGNVSVINPTIIDTREVPLVKKGLYVNDLTSATSININSVKLINPRLVNIPNITWRVEQGIEDPLFNLKGYTTGLNVVTNGISYSSIYSNEGASATTTATLSRFKNSPPFTFVVEENQWLRVTLSSGEISGFIESGEYLQSDEIGSKLTLKCVNEELNIWVVESMTGVWRVLAKNKTWTNGYLLISEASTIERGLVNQSTAVLDVTIADSEVTTAPEATDEVTTRDLANDLKAKYDAMVLLVNELKSKQNEVLDTDRASGQRAT